MLSSIAIILGFSILFQVLRRQLKGSHRLSEGVKDVIIWGLCSLELGCVAQEQGVLMEEAGLLVWAVSLVAVVTWQISAWEGLSPNALGNIVTMTRPGLLRVPAMLAGSLISYRLMSYFWMLELSTKHRDRGVRISAEMCELPWASSSLLLSMMTEYLGTLLLVTIPRLYIFSNPTLANNDASMRIRGFITGLLVLFVVWLGMDISGAMFNPTLASLLVGGCRGHSLSDHVLVYWVPPVAAAFSGDYLCAKVERGLEAETAKIKKKL